MKQCSRDQQHTVRLTLNGAARGAACEPRMLLSDFLREGLGATGTHVGCEHGVCGACTVQIDGVGVWDRGSNVTGWSALLGDRRGGPDVSIYAAPARATDLAGLPPAYIDCGSAEVFRDEDVAYAAALWAAGEGRARA